MDHSADQTGERSATKDDGAISPQVIERLKDKMEYFILGTAGLFGKEKSYAETMKDLRSLGQQKAA